MRTFKPHNACCPFVADRGTVAAPSAAHLSISKMGEVCVLVRHRVQLGLGAA
jgi:hypothetical protein